MFLWKALWLFPLFARDKGDYIDVWMIKITSKQIKIVKVYRVTQNKVLHFEESLNSGHMFYRLNICRF